MFSCQHIYATASTAQQQSKAILLLTEGLKCVFSPFSRLHITVNF